MEITELLEFIIEDIKGFWGLYALQALVIGITAACFIACVDLLRVLAAKLRKRECSVTFGCYLKDVICYMLFFAYLSMVAGIVFLSREEGAGYPMNWNLFSTWTQSAYGQRYFMENILLFIPFGLLFPTLSRFTEKWYVCWLIGGSCSIFIECVQLITGRGRFEVDDIMTNFLGCVIGFFLFKIFKLLGKGEKRT